MVILRVLGGFSVSAADIIITYMVEILPQRYRGNSVLLLEVRLGLCTHDLHAH
jgi:hypothetical protein